VLFFAFLTLEVVLLDNVHMMQIFPLNMMKSNIFDMDSELML